MEQSMEILRLTGIAVKSSAKKFLTAAQKQSVEITSNKKGDSKWRI